MVQAKSADNDLLLAIIQSREDLAHLVLTQPLSAHRLERISAVIFLARKHLVAGWFGTDRDA